MVFRADTIIKLFGQLIGYRYGISFTKIQKRALIESCVKLIIIEISTYQHKEKKRKMWISSSFQIPVGLVSRQNSGGNLHAASLQQVYLTKRNLGIYQKVGYFLPYEFFSACSKS